MTIRNSCVLSGVFRHTAQALALAATGLAAVAAWGDEARLAERHDAVARTLRDVVSTSCGKCHGAAGEVMGDVDLVEVRSVADLAARPELIRDLIEVLDAEYMPPEDEAPLAPETRAELVDGLNALLRSVARSQREYAATPMRRMNRFQYNNAVQDLFRLKVAVFPLPELILREHGNYFQPHTGKMPDKVLAGSRPLGKSQLIEPRLAGVTPFPQDLRAEHGFDNRADHLSMSPLLLESFLRLSRSIVESADFHAKTCGIWGEFFAPPDTTDQAELRATVQTRLRGFLRRAFRGPVEEDVVARYSDHVLARIDAGESFTDGMKSAAAATIASPRFLYLYGAATDHGEEPGSETKRLDDFALASRLSFFLWGSIPDERLLEAAAASRLHEPDVLTEQVERMLRDRRLKRFCDSFPAQWLQLERIISSEPDPAQYPQFYFGKYRASMHMMLEPLLLFETLLIEDQSILQLIDSDFSYRSDLLQAWYRNGSQGKAGSPVVVEFRRVPVSDRRQGGVITNAAVMTMTSGATRTKPITRGAWVASVILNDPPEPPPADVPPLADKPAADEEHLTLRERFAAHRQRADCAACHQRIDPLGFALENYDAAGIWRDRYENGRPVDPSGELFGKREFSDVVTFKDALLAEKDRFTRAFAAHLLSFATARELSPADTPTLDQIVQTTANANYQFHTLIKAVVVSDAFQK